MKYSVVMTVYKKDKPEWFKEAAESMLMQSVSPDEFILIKDGPISKELEKEIINTLLKNKRNIKVLIHEFKENMGAGIARQKAVELVSNEYLAFLDSDDISIIDRVEKQLNIFANNDVDFVGSNVYEFQNDISNIVSKVIMPETNKEVIQFAKKRCPARQSGSMIKKSSIINAGGYIDSPLTEDWHLYIRMILNNSKFYNLQDFLTYVRVGDDFYSRRGGTKYLKKIVSFKKWLLEIKYINIFEFLITSIPSILVCLMPNSLRDYVYRTFLRK